jgi:hypothetical protein
MSSRACALVRSFQTGVDFPPPLRRSSATAMPRAVSRLNDRG